MESCQNLDRTSWARRAQKSKNVIFSFIRKFLSPGLKRRLTIGLALVFNPLYRFFDEPTNNTDPEFRKNLRILLKLIKKQQRGGFNIYFSKGIKEMQPLCDKLAILRDGSFVLVGSVPEIAQKVTGYHLEIKSSKFLKKVQIFKKNFEKEERNKYLEEQMDIDFSSKNEVLESQAAKNEILELLKKICKFTILKEEGEKIDLAIFQLRRVSFLFNNLDKLITFGKIDDYFVSHFTLQNLYLTCLAFEQAEDDLNDTSNG